MQRTIEQLNSDFTLDDVKVWWQGRYVILQKQDGTVLTSLDTELPDLLGRIVRWLSKNSMRCSQIHDGRIWL
jgi:hypothetical protein